MNAFTKVLTPFDRSLQQVSLLAPPRAPWLVVADASPELSRELARAISAAATATVKCVASGNQLLELLGRCWVRSRYMGRSAFPDLVVADLRLPEVSGVEAMCSLTDAGVRIPFIVTSDRGDAERMEVERRGGVFLVKPVVGRQFVAAVTAALGRSVANAA